VKVFKYRGGDSEIFNRDLESLVKNSFWAPARDKLNDPCEGLFSADRLFSQIDILGETFSIPVIELKHSLTEVLAYKNTSGIYSLSKTSTDELLWAHYASNHSGFCIEYDLDRLTHFGKREFFHFDVEYDEVPPEINISDMHAITEKIPLIQKIIGYKSKRWEYEEEIRIITSASGAQDYDYRSVTAIHFGLRAGQAKIDDVMYKLQGRGIKYYRVRFKSDSYKLISEPISDLYPTDKKYLYSVAPITDYAVDIESINPKWDRFKSYLPKVAEIVRREPYCNEVLMVEISEDKSTDDTPIFFGQFKRARHRYENIYFTLEEVDRQYSQISDLASA